MKLLICCENYPPSVGGVQEVIRQVAERLVSRGHAVTVATSEHPRRPRTATIAGVRVESFRVFGNLVRGMEGDVEDYRRAVLGGNYDAVLVKAAQQWAFDALTPVLEQIPSRLVFIPCGFSGFYHAAYREYYRSMARWLHACDALIFYSSTYRDIDFAKACGVRTIHVLPNGADEREFASCDDGGFRSELGINLGAPLLLSVGTLIAAKGHWEVVEAFDLARIPEPATLIINGNDPYGNGRYPLARLLAPVRSGKLPLSWLVRKVNVRHRGRKRVLLTNFARPKLVQAYKAADLFISASRVEYSPLVLFEAAASRTPFLSPPVGNAREIVTWTGGGLVYPAAVSASGHAHIDARVLAEHIERCLAMGGGLRAMGDAGRSHIISGGFTWDAIVPRYEAVLSGKV